jgi:hypothetical protein
LGQAAGDRPRKGKEVVQEKEVVGYKVILEKAGHRDGFYGE